MKILQELNQSECDALKAKYKDQPNFDTHWKIVLNKPHCFVLDLSPDDYKSILIYSVIPEITKYPERQPLAEVVEFIKANQDFLKKGGWSFLNGEQVQHYLVLLKGCHYSLQDCFVKLGDCFMLDKNESQDVMRNEITDGMHRLVAYGLATNLDEKYFPIPIYFGTNKTRSVVEAG